MNDFHFSRVTYLASIVNIFIRSVIERLQLLSKKLMGTSDLVFDHESSPLVFWIIRRSEPNASKTYI